MKPMHRIVAITCGLLTAGAVATGVFNGGLVSQKAAAVVGRPATPGSVAGVARRTTRRMVRRSAIYVASLPTGCTTIIVEGASIYQCGATYYQPYGSQYEVVYLD